MTHNLAIFCQTPELHAKAMLLAEQLHLPVITEHSTQYDYLVVLTLDYLGIENTRDKSLPLYVDFLSKQMTYRRQHASLRKEAVARALGLKGNTQPYIIDATAGLGRDSFILASLGFTVTLLERSPITYALLEDGIQRAKQDAKLASIMQKLTLLPTDAMTWFTEHTQQNKPDIIYLDPMFPERDKSALVKKEMRIFHDVIGDDLDADRLLPAALSCATQRVVVKRPRLAPNLAGLTPSFSHTGSSSRFDIYLV